MSGTKLENRSIQLPKIRTKDNEFNFDRWAKAVRHQMLAALQKRSKHT
ncbi:MAG: hypothetical protein F6K45_03940 [Kamptonema sp. SIO1D9]|nr:hypothetical protein [Kamptonema sp. SIO1D9]